MFVSRVSLVYADARRLNAVTFVIQCLMATERENVFVKIDDNFLTSS
jgi:hypothetical protein